MRLLVTNDDGIDAAGISELASAAADTGMDLVVAAPIEERSGSSAALVMAGSGSHSEQVRLAAAPSIRAYGVRASPAMIIVMACRGAFGPPPNLVLSGINHGPNTGRAVLHSGTVGATFTAVAHGVPGIAFSHLGTSPDSWITAGVVARHVIRWALGRSTLPRLVLNVNIPDCAPGELRGLRAARLATFGAAQAQMEEERQTSTVTVSPGMDPPELETDDVLLAAGFATVTPVTAPCERLTALPGLLAADLLVAAGGLG